MLLRNFAFVAIVAVTAWIAAGYLEKQTQVQPGGASVTVLPAETASVAPKPAAPLPAGQAMITANSSGHFVATFTINGKAVEGMVDTGASLIAMNESTARRLGYGGSDLDYKYKTQTANGEGLAAAVMLDRVELGGVRVSNVQAFVLKDKALGGTLIGMTFLNRLASFKVENGKLKLQAR